MDHALNFCGCVHEMLLLILSFVQGSLKPLDPQSGAGGCPNFDTFPLNPQYSFDAPVTTNVTVVRIRTVYLRNIER